MALINHIACTYFDLIWSHAYLGWDSPLVSGRSFIDPEALQNVEEHSDDDIEEEEEEATTPRIPESPEQLSDDKGRHDSDEETPPHDATPDDDEEDSEDLLEVLHRLLLHRWWSELKE